MNICIFCSTNELPEVYTKPAAELATLIARGGHTLIWGGSNYGLMKVIADSAQNADGKIVGISFEFFKAYARPNADEMIIAKTLAERKALFLERSDALVVLVGGLGTLDEMTEILELKKQGKHNKPVVFLNTAGFYDGLKTQLERMEKEGFLPIGELEGVKAKTLADLAQFVTTPQAVMDQLGVKM